MSGRLGFVDRLRWFLQDGAYSPHTCARALLAHDAEEPQFAGALDVRSAADLPTEVVDRVDLHDLAVSLAEEANGAGGECGLQ